MRAKPGFATSALIAAGLGVLSCSHQAPAADAPAPVTHTVTIKGMRFEPERLIVNAGDTVVWNNTDLVPHTATVPGGGFDSATIDVGGSWRFTAGAKGTSHYVCSFHPTMKATLDIR